MTKIVEKLSKDLVKELRKADEIWIAVALMSFDGLDTVLKSIKSSCRQNYLIGLDLPTDPKSLKTLNALQLKGSLDVRLYTENATFHPKVYLIRAGQNYSAFVGSANCTNGGLFSNIELTVHLTDKLNCRSLLKWFNFLYDTGKPLTTKFIDKYEKDYIERQERKKLEQKAAKKEKELINEEIKAIISERSGFIKALQKYRNSSKYQGIIRTRKNTVKELNEALDYPNFNHLDIERYFSYWDLGHLIPIAKPAINRNISKLKKLLKWLCNESIDVAIRYEEALTGKFKVEGVSKAFVTKVLVAHRPNLYFVKNNTTERALHKYGVQLPRGLSQGEKYKITCRFLQQICDETNIKDLSVLDYYLYLEGQED